MDNKLVHKLNRLLAKSNSSSYKDFYLIQYVTQDKCLDLMDIEWVQEEKSWLFHFNPDILMWQDELEEENFMVFKQIQWYNE